MNAPILSRPVQAQRELQAQLISGTVNNALRTPFYRRHLAGVNPAEISLNTLSTLPGVTKTQLLEAGRSAQVRDDLVCDEIFTSGTTGPPFVSVRGDREQAFIRAFYQQFYAGFDYTVRPRGVQINNPYHGGHVTVPSPLHMHRIGIYDRDSFEYARSLLTGSHRDAGVAAHCTVLVGLERAIRAFAHDTLARHPDGLFTQLDAVVTYAQYLTERGRSLIERAFNAPVRDRYGMSEVFGGAAQGSGGWYHFDPSVVAEVVAPSTHNAIREGVGLLVLTALYPFQEAQPLIRYLTGDIVRVTHADSSRPGEIAIKPMGRERYGILTQDGSDWLLLPADVYEVIDTIDEIKRAPLFRDSSQVLDPYLIGHPRYHVQFRDEGRCRCITISIELKEDAMRSVDRISESLRAGVLLRSASAQAALSAGACTLYVVATSHFDHDVISYRE
ncbi:phenylacetate--CoA ligase family protein [Paraburkholderia sediminicola]|uniref:hypothetical protein n=1 Tax=Paraburkholderia sediminicola TaxID=458836 RepID=UPI0038B7F174